MKTLFMILMVLFSVTSFASEQCSTQVGSEEIQDKLEIKTDVPKFLEGATICVKLASGKESCVPAEKFKVVARQQQFIVTKTKQTTATTCNIEKDKEKNRVSLLAGKGPQEGLNVSRTATEATIESKVGAIGGVQYQRLLTDKISVGVQGQTNQSLLLNVGLDF